jgi:hypothetical protein
MKDSIDDRAGAAIKRLSLDERDLQKNQIAFEDHLRAHSLELARERKIRGVNFQKADVDIDTIREKATSLSSLLHINPQPVLDFDLFPGFQLLAPPYDTSWNVGAGTPLSAWDGTSIIFGGGRGSEFSASGFGIHLSSDRHVSVSVMPQGRFTAGWVNFLVPALVRSLGGTGAVVYSDGSLLLSRKPEVWDVRDPAQFTGAQFDLLFASTATPPIAGSFGPVPLAPVLFEMLPGKRYLIWFYIWQLNNVRDGEGFVVFSQAKVPLIAARVGPPLILPR